MARTWRVGTASLVLALGTGAWARAQRLPVSNPREILASDPAAFIRLLDDFRPASVTSETKQMVLKSLPPEAEITVLNAAPGELAVLYPVVRATRQDGVDDVKGGTYPALDQGPEFARKMAAWMAVAGRGAEPELAPLPLIVAIHDSAALPPRVLERAKRAATEIYRRIGVSLTWFAGPLGADAVPTDPPACPDSASPLIHLRLVGRSANADRPTDNLGFAVSGGTLASVLVKPVADLANRESLNVGDLLGVVMAHEIGHLLLPANSHSMGIMAARIDLFWISRGGPSFTHPQASMIRARLVSMADCKQMGLTSSKDGVH